MHVVDIHRKSLMVVVIDEQCLTLDRDHGISSSDDTGIYEVEIVLKRMKKSERENQHGSYFHSLTPYLPYFNFDPRQSIV